MLAHIPDDMWGAASASANAELFEALNDKYQSFEQKLSSPHCMTI